MKYQRYALAALSLLSITISSGRGLPLAENPTNIGHQPRIIIQTRPLTSGEHKMMQNFSDQVVAASASQNTTEILRAAKVLDEETHICYLRELSDGRYQRTIDSRLAVILDESVFALRSSSAYSTNDAVKEVTDKLESWLIRITNLLAPEN